MGNGSKRRNISSRRINRGIYKTKSIVMANFIYKLFSEEQVTEFLSRQKEINSYRSEMEITEVWVSQNKLKSLIKEYLSENKAGYFNSEIIELITNEIEYVYEYAEDLNTIK